MTSNQALLLASVAAIAIISSNIQIQDKPQQIKPPKFLKQTAPTYTYYTSAYVWLQTFCTELMECNFYNSTYFGNYNGLGFNIAGLWPSGNNFNATNYCFSPEWCTGINYTETGISTATMNSMQSWFVGGNMTDVQFRQHEWDQHGTCFVPSTQQNVDPSNPIDTWAYNIVSLNTQYNIFNSFSKHGITPSKTVGYPLTNMINALAIDYGLISPEFQCETDSQGNQYLNQILIYLDLNYDPITCPCSSYSSCTTASPIFFYPFTPPFTTQTVEL